MNYTFQGRLCGYICPDAEEPISNATVRLYRPDWDRQGEVVRAAAAEPKETFAVLDGEAVGAKSNRQIAEVETDEDGEFAVELGEEQNYDGDAFQVDVRTDHVPGRYDEDADPVQFTITTLQPRWRQTEDGIVSRWEYCIPRRSWCEVRRQFGAWVVCGRVTEEETGDPVPRAPVSVYDADIVEDDPLGEDTTDTDGTYRIYYTTSDFERTPAPFGPIELKHGPDLYFLVRGVLGTPLLEEPRSRGRQSDREDASPCERVDLVVTDEPPPGPDPLFSDVGPFGIQYHIDDEGKTVNVRGPPGDRVGGEGYGFFGDVTLEGFCPETHPDTGEPMYYRFLFRERGSDGETPITGTHIEQQEVATAPFSIGDDFGFPDIYVSSETVEGDLGPEPVTVIPTARNPNDDLNGWIEVKKTFANGYQDELLKLDTTSLVPGGDPEAVTPGDEPDERENGKVVEIIFETTVADDDGNPDPDEIDRQRVVAELHINNFEEVRQLRVEELAEGAEGGCTEITDEVTVEYTVDHELLDEWKLKFESDAPPTGGYPPTPSPDGSSPRGVHGRDSFDVSEWPECSYKVLLQSKRKLTDGRENDDWDTEEETFCIVRSDDET